MIICKLMIVVKFTAVLSRKIQAPQNLFHHPCVTGNMSAVSLKKLFSPMRGANLK